MAENINLVVVSISAGDEEVNAVRKVAYLNAFVRVCECVQHAHVVRNEMKCDAS